MPGWLRIEFAAEQMHRNFKMSGGCSSPFLYLWLLGYNVTIVNIVNNVNIINTGNIVNVFNIVNIINNVKVDNFVNIDNIVNIINVANIINNVNIVNVASSSASFASIFDIFTLEQRWTPSPKCHSISSISARFFFLYLYLCDISWKICFEFDAAKFEFVA